jgi:7-cyano-7-deazaguanine synthase
LSSEQKKAVVLLSGGLDSTTCLAIAVLQGYSVYALSFEYGQKHKVELEFAKENAGKYGAAEHRTARLDKDFFSASSLTDRNRIVQKNSLGNPGIPDTYVPARNTVFLSYALAYAENIGAETIFIGANSIDYSGYPDCRPEYISAFQNMANLALKDCVEGRIKLSIKAPLIAMTKAEIIRLGKELGVDYSKTVSCYDPVEGKACGQCDSCLLRKKGFEESGHEDETVYV